MPRAFASLLLLTALSGFAQDPNFVQHTPRTDYLFTEEVDPAYVLGNEVAMRRTPELNGELVAVLSVGTKLLLEERGADTLIHNGIGSNWFRAKAGNAEGWIWGGNIARFASGSSADPTVKFVGGVDHIVRPNGVDRIDFSFRIVAIRDGKELDRIVVRSFAWGFGEVKNQGSCGLKNVDDVITLEVPCVGGCGCSTGDVVVFWSGGKFRHAMDVGGSPDGIYSGGSTLIYPADIEGIPGVVIKHTSTYDEVPLQAMEYGNPEELTRIVMREYLVWNGKALVPSDRPTEERRYQMRLDE